MNLSKVLGNAIGVTTDSSNYVCIVQRIVITTKCCYHDSTQNWATCTI